MWELKFDPSKPKLRKILKEHEELALRYFWDEKAEEGGSKDVWPNVNERLGEGKSISRATIINFLQAMSERGVLNSRMESGKGGYHGIYSQNMDEKEFQKYVLRTIITSMYEDFPESTREVLRELRALAS